MSRRLSGMVLGLTLLVALPTAMPAERYGIDPRSLPKAGDGKAARVLILHEDVANRLALQGKKREAALEILSTQGVRSIEMVSDDGASPMTAQITELKDQQKLRICLLPPKVEGVNPLYVSLWNRVNHGTGPQSADIVRLYPKVENGIPVAADQVHCLPSTFLARHDGKDLVEQVNAHFTRSLADQISPDDVMVIGKSAGTRTVAPIEQDYWEAVATYRVSK